MQQSNTDKLNQIFKDILDKIEEINIFNEENNNFFYEIFKTKCLSYNEDSITFFFDKKPIFKIDFFGNLSLKDGVKIDTTNSIMVKEIGELISKHSETFTNNKERIQQEFNFIKKNKEIHYLNHSNKTLFDEMLKLKTKIEYIKINLINNRKYIDTVIFYNSLTIGNTYKSDVFSYRIIEKNKFDGVLTKIKVEVIKKDKRIGVKNIAVHQLKQNLKNYKQN